MSAHIFKLNKGNISIARCFRNFFQISDGAKTKKKERKMKNLFFFHLFSVRLVAFCSEKFSTRAFGCETQ